MDRKAFDELHERCHRRLYSYLCRVSGDAALAEDVLQDAFLKVLLAENPPREAGRLDAYLFRTATHRLYDRWRRSRKETSWQETLEVPAPRGRDPAMKRDLRRVLDLLKPRQRALLWLAHVEGLSHREIAQILDVRETSVRVLLFRARKKMASLARKIGLDEERPRA